MNAATQSLRRRRTTLLVALAVVVALVLLAWLQRDRATYGDPLDPRNPRPDGAQAVARVLAGHGVDVDVVRGERALLDHDLDRSTSVVVSNADALGRSTLGRLRTHTAAAGTLVLAGSSPTVLRGYGLRAAAPLRGTVAAGCADPLFRDLQVRVSTTEAVATVSSSACFGSDGRSLLVRPDDRTWVMTAPEVLTNDAVLDADNAAVALRLLGQQPHVLWYVADPADTVAADAVSVQTFLPRWLVPGLWLLAVAAVAFLLWRGRRLGPLVREPIPVVVRAAESTESRGRLYRRTRDRNHAARILRAATRRTLADRLALPDDDAATVAAALPHHRDLVTDDEVRDDAALAQLARDLNRLEDQTR